VLNDDVIAGPAGFGAHSHSNMEIITVLPAVQSLTQTVWKTSFEVPAGDVQVMSAGTGVTHSEENASRDKELLCSRSDRDDKQKQ